MTNQQIFEFGMRIDKACDNQDVDKLKLIITEIENYILSPTVKQNALLHYFLANAWNGLREIKHKTDSTSIWDYEQKEIEQEIINLRKAKQDKEFSTLAQEYKLSILTNLANIMNHIGRSSYALSLYNQALTLNPNFLMARVNRGICLITYLNSDYDNGHKGVFGKMAYSDFKQAIELFDEHIKLYEFDKDYYISVQKLCFLKIEELKNYFSKDFFLLECDLDNFSLGRSKREKKYRKWSLDNTLFLNPINDIGSFNIASHDPLNLPSMIHEIKISFPKEITYFNQLKQEFIFYRSLFYENIEQEKVQNFFDKDTSIIDDYDYNLYNIDTEKIKLSFRGFYSLFDKISYFLNDYFELGIKPKKINFRTLWLTKKEKLNTDKFSNFENLALRGLYFISKDIFFYEKDETYIETLDPKAKEINKLRNHLEHNFISIKVLDTTKYNVPKDREEVFICIDDLEEKTKHLAQLAREAIIYLSFIVHNEEKKKDSTDTISIDLNIYNN